MLTRSRDIRYQSRKSEIAPKFGRFLALPNFRRRDFQKLYARYEPCIAADRLEKFHEDIPTSSEVIEAHTLNFKPNFKFLRLQFFWGPPSPFKYALTRFGQSLARVKKLRAQHPLRAEILCPEQCPLGCVNMHLYNFLACGPKFTTFLLSNVGGVVADQLCFRFLMCRRVPEIFAIKVESCEKSRRNLEVFWPSQILGGGTSKTCTHVMSPASRLIAWKSFMRIFPLARKL